MLNFYLFQFGNEGGSHDNFISPLFSHQTGYDLSVLRMMSDGTPALGGSEKPPKISSSSSSHPHHQYGSPSDPPPDIQTFLQSNKDRVDGDPDSTPFDDLRHYAYEGDGNSNASLSSLNSGTSDGDLQVHRKWKIQI